MRTLASLLATAALVGGVTIASAQYPTQGSGSPTQPSGGESCAAKKVMAAAEAEAAKNNWAMVIIILDSTGHPVMLKGRTKLAREAGAKPIAERRTHGLVVDRCWTWWEKERHSTIDYVIQSEPAMLMLNALLWCQPLLKKGRGALFSLADARISVSAASSYQADEC
jgi:hypothetical protein